MDKWQHIIEKKLVGERRVIQDIILWGSERGAVEFGKKWRKVGVFLSLLNNKFLSYNL